MNKAAEQETRRSTLAQKLLAGDTSVSIVQFLFEQAENPTDSPAWPVSEDNIALLLGPFYKGHTGVLLPVPHGLAENSPLAA